MDNLKIAKEIAEYSYHKLTNGGKNEPPSVDKTKRLAENFLAEINLLSENQNAISGKNLKIIDEGLMIDDKLVPQEIFDNEKYEYYPIYKEDIVNDLIGWIAEANKDKEAMKEDLEYILSHNDKILFSSISTNEYVFQSSEPKSFDEICDDLLKL